LWHDLFFFLFFLVVVVVVVVIVVVVVVCVVVSCYDILAVFLVLLTPILWDKGFISAPLRALRTTRTNLRPVRVEIDRNDIELFHGVP
jgi:hypothetical protein